MRITIWVFSLSIIGFAAGYMTFGQGDGRYRTLVDVIVGPDVGADSADNVVTAVEKAELRETRKSIFKITATGLAIGVLLGLSHELRNALT